MTGLARTFYLRIIKKVYDELYYEVFRESAPEVMRQTLAVVLYALSLHGYGEKRLRQVLDWTQDVLSMPTVRPRHELGISGCGHDIGGQFI